jgi:hypothetical protein
MNRIPRVWVTQYCLTKGIEVYDDVMHTAARTKNGVGSVRVSPYVVVFAPHWYDNLEAAQARAESMRQDAIAATKRRLAKLEALKISVSPGSRE